MQWYSVPCLEARSTASLSAMLQYPGSKEATLGGGEGCRDGRNVPMTVVLHLFVGEVRVAHLVSTIAVGETKYRFVMRVDDFGEKIFR